jgi:hypothetical protein
VITAGYPNRCVAVTGDELSGSLRYASGVTFAARVLYWKHTTLRSVSLGLGPVFEKRF